MNKKVDLKSILILDDDQEFRTLLKSLLSKSFQDVEIHEYDPIKKGEPEKGFDWSMFDILILDYYLCIHGLTGLDLFQKHQQSPGFPPTIMLTGAGNERVAIRAFKFGIKDYIRKDELNATNISEAINKAYEEHHVKQNTQRELQLAEKQIQEDRSNLEKEADIINLQLQKFEEEELTKQQGMAEVERIKSEAEAQIQKERSELENQAADVNSQLQSIEEEKRLHQDAMDEVQRMNNEAEEQIQKERAELTKEAAAMKQQLQDIEEEKRKQQDAMDEVQRMKNEAEEQIQKERS